MFDNLPSIVDLEETIMNTINMVWFKNIQHKDISNWLNHFDGSFLKDREKEHKLALLLLNNFVFYNIEEIRYLCRRIYKKYLHYQFENIELDNSISLNQHSVNLIDKTIFIPIGNPSESGSNLLYYYRQENLLPKNKFYFDYDMKMENIQNIVFVDDVSLSGSQLLKYVKENINKLDGKNVFFTPLMITAKAKDVVLKEIKDEYGIDIVILPGLLLDERERVFSDSSYIFKGNADLLKITKEFVEFYSKKFNFKEKPLGFDNSELALGFFYNIPNNSLPIYWYQNREFEGIFERKSKIYGNKYKDLW